MKLFIALSMLASSVAPALAQVSANRIPSQEFFVPLPEEMLYYDSFMMINWYKAVAPIHTLISLVVSTTDTVIYYDHWEDGYESDVTNPANLTTEIWGDGDPTNGCVPKYNDDGERIDCAAYPDKLTEGQAIILQSVVAIPRNPRGLVTWDGGDRILATFPIAVTRAAYPDKPGSLMAGAVEVLDTSGFGTEFWAPVSTDLKTKSGHTDAFQYTAVYISAAEDDTTVTFPNGTEWKLNKGESVPVRIEKLDENIITSDKPTLAQLITGDRWSQYEARWFSLLKYAEWSNEYLSAVGDSRGQTRVLCYNPSDSDLTITYTIGTQAPQTFTVKKKTADYSPMVPTGSAMYLTAPTNFLPLSVTDTKGAGQTNDWGFPVMPMHHLTPQVVIGLGFGCTNNNCGWANEQSVVWVAPEEDCWIHVDYNNNGVLDPEDKSFEATKFSSNMLKDPTDKDMSGALIYATKLEDKKSDPVRMAAAWGQDPQLAAGQNQAFALDLGTVVLPFPTVKASKHVKILEDKDNNGGVSAGDILEYSIKVINMGQVGIPSGSVIIKDDGLSDKVEYIEGSFNYEVVGTGMIQHGEDTTTLAFLEAGMATKEKLEKRGGTHVVSFKVKVLDTAVAGDTIVNTGVVKPSGSPKIPLLVESPVVGPLRWAPSYHGSCMRDYWMLHGKTGNLQCTSQAVTVENIKGLDDMVCELGKPVTLTITGSIKLGGQRSDTGWYVAQDGGDALNGQCSIGYFAQDYSGASLVRAAPGNFRKVGDVTWDQDKDGNNDECGDVSMDGSDSGYVDYKLLVDSPVTCMGDNGKLKVSICFSWKQGADDSFCSVAQAIAAGDHPDILPGNPNSCYCGVYEVPNVIVLDPGNKVYPC